MTVTGNSVNGAMLSPSPAQIEVASGRYVDLLNPDPGTITLADIAVALSNTCRYGGHVSVFYSVAEHALLVRDLLRSQGASERVQAGALFHDAAEAFLGDLPSPLKWSLRQLGSDGYDMLTARMEGAIADGLRIQHVFAAAHDPLVGLADMWALRIEAANLTYTGGENWRWPGQLPNGGEKPDDVTWIGGMPPIAAHAHWYAAAQQAVTS